MSEHKAFTGVLVDIDFLKTSGKARFVIEVEKEMANEAFRRIGGYPDPAESRWIGVAVMDSESGNAPETSSSRVSHDGEQPDASLDENAEREAFDL